MSSIAQLQKLYPLGGAMPLLVTEVTRMKGGFVCVATYDIHHCRMIRPLQWNHQNWPEHVYDSGTVRPGTVIGVSAYAQQANHGRPHSTEDVQLAAAPVKLGELSDEDFYAALIGTVDPSVAAIFGNHIVNRKYIVDETDCRSLGAVAIPPSGIRFHDGNGKLRCEITDTDGNAYDLPVTALELLSFFGSPNTGVPELGAAEANELLAQYSDDEPCVLRIGLAHGWNGPDKSWSPKRCYLQLNGVVFVEARMNIFADPPDSD